MREIALLARRVFREKELVFMYRSGIEYDEAAAELLKRMNKRDRGALEPFRVTPLRHWPTIKDMPEGCVYFSWYTFEYLIDQANFAEALRKRTIFATTKNHVRMYEGACAGASVDDVEAGQIGGEMIINDLMTAGREGHKKFGQLPIRSPKVHLWLNCDNANIQGIRFNTDLLRDAGEGVFGNCN